MRLNRLSLVSALLCLVFQFQLSAQVAPKNWMLADPDQDKMAGTSTTRAYNELLKGKKSTPIIVAVIDNGTDVEHPDLKDNIWTNTKEIPGNGKDDDGNGYVDDIHGWNFIGGKDGNVDKDNLEITREYKRLSAKYANSSASSVTDKKEYDRYLDIKKKFEGRMIQAKTEYATFSFIMKGLKSIQKASGKKTPTLADIKAIDATGNDSLASYKAIYEQILSNNAGMDTSSTWTNQFEEYYTSIETRYKYQYSTDFDTRFIVGDNYDNVNEHYYGNADVSHPTPMHGTHVAGIIAAIRGNNIGIDGIADNVKIMVIRCVPDGDERDKDVANAIRYAVDNGAKVINMSFGKSYSPYKSAVDAAVKYAQDHDVLLVHASGNDAHNIDVSENYPSPFFLDGTRPTTWIEVGAINKDFDRASFSNYGKKNVDIFSPGENIYSTVPNGEYAFESGTSMASPVCAGVAAVLRSYYPQLTAVQIKQILLETVYKPTGKVHIPGKAKAKKKKKTDKESEESPKQKTVALSKICVSGGIVNLYYAVKKADEMTKK